MIPWDNVTISARAPITKANKRLRSLTVGAGRHGMAVSRGLVAQNGRCIRCFASPLTNRASACGMAAQVQIDQPRINGTPFQTPPCLQYTAHASWSKHRSVVPGDASGNVRASVSPTCLGFSSETPTSVLIASSDHIPTALWLSLRYTSALETLHLNSDPPSPADGLISYPVGRRTTKLT